MIKKRFAVFMIAIFIMSLPVIVNADFGDEIKLLASDGAASDVFGYSVSISGDTAIVGVLYDDDNGTDSGSAYVYTETAVLPAPEIDVTDSIGADGDFLMPFGNITNGLSSEVETVTISNTGTVDLNVTNIQLTGADTGEYSLDINGGATPCGVTTLTIAAAGFRDRKRIGLMAVMLIFAGALLVSCGSRSHNSNYKTYTVTGLNSGATYYWGVAAKDDKGGETLSDVWKFTTKQLSELLRRKARTGRVGSGFLMLCDSVGHPKQRSNH